MEHDYYLERNLEASARLSLQHFIMRQKNGFSIHPEIEADLKTKESPRIADIGTGNCIWAFEVAHQYPQASMSMTDISDKQLPARDYWPSNTSFTQWDFFQAPPSGFEGQFDFVHIAIVAPFVSERADILMKNLFSLLKPGGYLQWTDFHFPPFNMYNLREDKTCVTDFVKSLQFPPWTWVNDFEGSLLRTGFQEVKNLPPPHLPWLAKFESECIALALDELATGRRARKLPGQEECDDALRRCKQAIADGVYIEYNLNVIVARK